MSSFKQLTIFKFLFPLSSSSLFSKNLSERTSFILKANCLSINEVNKNINMSTKGASSCEE